ncbi:MAG: 50S ribosomal protein L5 [Candidatus Saelkia tenebricola]|nr:50S ribosomal protein L5 [Candidatus Saelkia tenebricola]
MKSRLYGIYKEKIVPQLIEKFGYKNMHQIPQMKKIVINMGLGDTSSNKEVLEKAMEELALIAGQKPTVRCAKKSIANFKIRQGVPVGCKVTLRREKMYEFFDRLINVALPRVRDFQGIPANRGFDARGNYTVGLKEQTIFPEINLDKVKKIQGMDITFVTTAKNKEEAFELFQAFGVPFRRK